MDKHTLEPAARAFADATAQPPFLYELGPEGARKVLDDVQAAPIAKPDVDDTWITVPADVGDVAVRIVKPVGAPDRLPAVLYVHGGGWILGNAGTHDRLVRELAVGANAAIIFVEYDRSPEAQYPVAIEQAYATARWITEQGDAHGLDASRLAVAGDSVGGNMTAALAILAKQRGDVTFVHQSMYYPVTDAAQDTDSYHEFADGPFLTAKNMAWFWDAYCPDEGKRSEITVSPLRASLDELAGLPEALVIVDENDVLRDEGEAYARNLVDAGVRTTSVRFNGAIHDFMMLNPLRETAASTAAIEQAIRILRKALGTNESLTKEIVMNQPSAPDTIVLVHGFWVTPRSWEQWIPYYEAKGFRVLAPAYPGFEVEVEALNADPTPVEALTVPAIIEKLESVVGALDTPPIIMGHSAGGAFTQVLLDHGYGAAGVVMDSAPTEGVRVTPAAQVRASWPVLKNPANHHKAVSLTYDQWHYAFTNTFDDDESHRLYERYAVPASGRIFWDSVLANFEPGPQDVHVDYHNDARPPLLFLSGEHDHLMPPPVQRSNAKHYKSSKTITEVEVIDGRSHLMPAQDGWEEVADRALEWALTHVGQTAASP